MPDVVWTQGANTLTWDKGILSATPHRFGNSRVVSERLAGGGVVTYDLGLNSLEQIDYTFPHVTQAKLDAFITWKNTTVKERDVTFTHTDNSKSPALVETVRLWNWRYVEEAYTDPANPRYRVQVTLQVEPS